jgi:hypothetical protein
MLPWKFLLWAVIGALVVYPIQLLLTAVGLGDRPYLTIPATLYLLFLIAPFLFRRDFVQEGTAVQIAPRAYLTYAGWALISMLIVSGLWFLHTKWIEARDYERVYQSLAP